MKVIRLAWSTNEGISSATLDINGQEVNLSGPYHAVYEAINAIESAATEVIYQ